MEKNAFVEDILNQPDALRQAVNRFDPQGISTLVEELDAGQFDRIVITGMGASYHGMIPAWQRLVENRLPAWLVDTSELLYYTLPLITPRTLVWVVSQSGRSAEIQALLAHLADRPPARILGTVNDTDSPLAERADFLLPLHCVPEITPSTRTYLNTLAISQLAALQMVHEPVEPARKDLLDTAAGLDGYLTGWEAAVAGWVSRLGVPERLIVLGRGPSLATAYLAPLMLKESAKYLSEGMSAAQFRHGPLELAGPDLAVLFLEGDAKTRDLNLALARDLMKYHTHVFWLSPQPNPDLETVLLPASSGIGTVIAEVLPFQMLSLALCSQTGIEPGVFRFIHKVTTTL